MIYYDAIKTYFAAWLSKDGAALPAIFADDVIYSECYGPEYHGLDQIESWFADWNRRGTVLLWDIRNAIEYGNTLCAEWYFQCEYDGNVDGFNGVSWVEFDECGKIKALREFQSKAEHCFPYEKNEWREQCRKESI